MELQLVEWLRAQFGQAPQVKLGIGDDAAILSAAAEEDWIVTTDMLLEGSHFLRAHTPLPAIGRKALAVNLSDAAAMAARPMAAFVSLGLPHNWDLSATRALYEGMAQLAAEFDVAIAGGDTNVWNGPLVINVTLVASCPKGQALRRSGAKPGDVLLVTGSLGGSLHGKHLTFQPRVREALALRDACPLHAGCDLSDGLALDLWRITQASGCGAVLDSRQIPISLEAHLPAANGQPTADSPLQRALSDGEDFELLLAVDPRDADRILSQPPITIPLSRVGYCMSESGLWMLDAQGHRQPLEPRGYEHGGQVQS